MSPHETDARQLYMFYVGGNAGRSNIEVHDIQFAAVSRPEQAYSALREAWYGDPDKLHLDGYMPITWADGYAVSLGARPCPSGLKLFFINMGGYHQEQLAELHDFGLFVAASAEEAKAKARQSLLPDVDIPHRDNLKDIDHCLALSQFEGCHVQLNPDPDGHPDRPAWQGYLPIGTGSPA
ncbi:DUF1543 domain-containing protein [Frateuria aurantia]